MFEPTRVLVYPQAGDTLSFVLQTEGFEVGLATSNYRVPATCASCDGPRQTSVVVQTSRRSGNVTTILRMRMPYCKRCAARVPGAGWRMMLLYCAVTLLAVALPGLASFVASGGDMLIVAGAGAGVAALLSLPLALVLLPKKPDAPATARGEAVSLTRYQESGDVTVFCTNGAWAQKLAAGNHTSARQTSRLRLVEPLAVAWGFALAGGLVFMTWYYVENPPQKTPPPAAGQKPAPKPAAPAPAPAPKKR